MFKSGFIKLSKTVNTEIKKPKLSNDKGVVYLGHIPHGFYEKEMKQFFSQFGDVTNINIPKSQKTGKGRGYAFIEFMYPEVAKVVAETMNNYLMHKKILVAKFIPSNEIKTNMFWNCNTNRIPLTVKNRILQRKAMEKRLNPDQEKETKTALNKRLNSLQRKLKRKGIEYEIQTFDSESSKNVESLNETAFSNKASDNEDNLVSDTNIELDDEDEIKSTVRRTPKIKTHKLKKGKGHKLKLKK